MSQKRREERRRRAEGASSHEQWLPTLQAVFLGGCVALVVASTLLPSESAITPGTFAPIAAGWCLLLVIWASIVALQPRPMVLIGWTETVGVALLGWHSLVTLAALGRVNGRLALNAH